MTRKRFVKLIMARGYSRNEANELARAVVEDGGSYEREYAKIFVALSMLDVMPNFVECIISGIEALMAALPNVMQRISRMIEDFAETISKYDPERLAEALQER